MASTAAPSAPFLSPRPIQRRGGQRRGLGDADQLQGEVAVGTLLRRSWATRVLRHLRAPRRPATCARLWPHGAADTSEEEDDEERGRIAHSAGLERPRRRRTPTRSLFELDEWSGADRAVLPTGSRTLGVPHSWEGTTLVVAAADEAWVERIMDQVDEDLVHRRRGGRRRRRAGGLRPLRVGRRQLHAACSTLLTAEADPLRPRRRRAAHRLAPTSAGSTRSSSALTTPGGTLTVGGPGQLRGDERALRGQRSRWPSDPDDTGRRRRRSSPPPAPPTGASAPYGMDAAWWDGVVARAGGPGRPGRVTLDPDPEHVAEVAGGAAGRAAARHLTRWAAHSP